VFIVVGTLMFNHASRQLDAVPMSVFAQTEMVFTPVWAVVFLGLTPKPLTIVGGVIIFGAVIGKALHDTRQDTGDHRRPVPSGSLGG
jgi:drug/metabolite transporter (DMT)-like permease